MSQHAMHLHGTREGERKIKKLIRIISIMLFLFLLFSLTACSSNNQSELFPDIRTKWHSTKNNGVIFYARTDKDSYQIGEKVNLYYKVENKRGSNILQQLGHVDNWYVHAMGIKKEEYSLSVPLEGIYLYGTALSRPIIKSGETFEKDRVFIFDTGDICAFDAEKEERTTIPNPPTGKYTVTLKMEYADVSKLKEKEPPYDKDYTYESYQKALETQTVEFEITLTDAPTTTAE